MKVNVEINVKDASLRLSAQNAMPFAIHAVSQQALADCNYYCKQDTDTLIKSSHIHSDLDNGILRWVTPYAEYQYTYPGVRHDKNPNAVPEWCEKAQEMCGDRWETVFAKAYRKGLEL